MSQQTSEFSFGNLKLSTKNDCHNKRLQHDYSSRKFDRKLLRAITRVKQNKSEHF